MSCRALCVGCNYPGSAHELWGCHLDAQRFAAMLVARGVEDVTVLLDPPAHELTHAMSQLAAASRARGLSRVYVMLAGHCADGRFRGGDMEVANFNFCNFNTDTQLVFFFDCCWGNSLLRLRYRWRGRVAYDCGREGPPRALLIASDGEHADTPAGGALTQAIIESLDDAACRRDVFRLIHETKRRLRVRGYPQTPVLWSSNQLPRFTAIL
jgi:hypothetical protein